MSMTPENPHIGKHDPQREADWNDGFEESRAHFTARIAELEAENARLAAGLESVVRSMPPDEHGYVLPGRVQAELVLGGSKRPLERAQIQIADLEAQVREQGEALKAAREALQNALRRHRYCEDGWYSCPKDEDGCLDPSAGSDCNCGADGANASIAAALANPLIGGAK